MHIVEKIERMVVAEEVVVRRTRALDDDIRRPPGPAVVRQEGDRSAFDADVAQLVDYMKSCPLAPGFEEILIPGELERRTRQQCGEKGIAIDEETWLEITTTARKYKVEIPPSL